MAISRADLEYKSLDKYRICSHHFINGKAASLYNTTNPAWLPTLHLGHMKVKAVNNDRYERAIRRNAVQEMEGQLPTIVKAEIESFVTSEVEALVKKQLDKAKQYFKPSEEVEMLRQKCVAAEQTVEHLKAELGMLKAVAPFSEEDFKSDEFIRFYTGLPNVGILKATFEHVHNTLPGKQSTKLTLI